MSHPIPLPHPRLTKAELACLRHLIARTPDPSQIDDSALHPAVLPNLGWLDRHFPTV